MFSHFYYLKPFIIHLSSASPQIVPFYPIKAQTLLFAKIVYTGASKWAPKHYEKRRLEHKHKK